MILIDSSYINKSGGKTLLEYLLSEIVNASYVNETLVIIDSRIDLPIVSQFPTSNIFIINSSIATRHRLFREILDSKPVTVIFCFNNIPPSYCKRSHEVYIYFHNTLLLSASKFGYNIFKRAAFYLKRLYIILGKKSRYNWIVQTKKTADLLINALNLSSEKVLVKPLYKQVNTVESIAKERQFLYVADGVQQKNHQILFKAWQYLANCFELYPQLYLTFNPDEFQELQKEVDLLSKRGIKIANLGVCDEATLNSLYNQSEFLIFPSLTESFGLPLIEACQHGCKVITANLPYVFEVITPSATFNPSNVDELSDIVYNIMKKGVSYPKSEVIAEDQINKLLEILYKKKYVQG